jgi:hypothetical protein
MTDERSAFEKFFPAANANWLERSQQYSGPYHELWEGWQARGESDKSAEPVLSGLSKPKQWIPVTPMPRPAPLPLAGGDVRRIIREELRAHPSADRASVQAELPPQKLPSGLLPETVWLMYRVAARNEAHLRQEVANCEERIRNQRAEISRLEVAKA